MKVKILVDPKTNKCFFNFLTAVKLPKLAVTNVNEIKIFFSPNQHAGLISGQQFGGKTNLNCHRGKLSSTTYFIFIFYLSFFHYARVYYFLGAKTPALKFGFLIS